MLTTKPCSPHPSAIFSNADSIARQAGLIVRSSHKFSAAGFLITLLKTVSAGASSYNQMAAELHHHEAKAMSRQAISQRFSRYSTAFLLNSISALISEKSAPTTRAFRGLFKRILVEDSTVIPIVKSNHQEFPGNGNGRYDTAGCKINLITDLISGDAIDCSLHTARSADQSLADLILNHAREGDLILRDMGYFVINCLHTLTELKSHWISRFPASVNASRNDGTTLNELLADPSRMTLDEDLVIGSRGKTRVMRIVATRLNPAQVEIIRREKNRNMKKRGRNQSRKNIIRDEWRIMITSLDRDQADGQDLRDLYEMRWDIEIQFRAMKQSLQLTRCFGHKMGYFQIEALALTCVIHHLLSSRIYQVLTNIRNRTQISREKLCDLFSKTILRAREINDIWALMRSDPRHLKPERSPSLSLCPALVHCLS